MLLPTRSSISATVTQLDTAPHKQSGDAGFKRMLSTVVDTDCWEGARQAAGGHISTLGRQQDAAEGVAASLAASMQRLTARWRGSSGRRRPGRLANRTHRCMGVCWQWHRVLLLGQDSHHDCPSFPSPPAGISSVIRAGCAAADGGSSRRGTSAAASAAGSIGGSRRAASAAAGGSSSSIPGSREGSCSCSG